VNFSEKIVDWLIGGGFVAAIMGLVKAIAVWRQSYTKAAAAHAKITTDRAAAEAKIDAERDKSGLARAKAQQKASQDNHTFIREELERIIHRGDDKLDKLSAKVDDLQKELTECKEAHAVANTLNHELRERYIEVKTQLRDALATIHQLQVRVATLEPGDEPKDSPKDSCPDR
jgi:chromosome segregation ATPase